MSALAPILLFAAAAFLSGCSSNLVADNLPTQAGGLPQDTPARPAVRPAYPAVHDMPPVRTSEPLSEDEQKRLEADLIEARKRVSAEAEELNPTGSTSTPPAGAEDSP